MTPRTGSLKALQNRKALETTLRLVKNLNFNCFGIGCSNKMTGDFTCATCGKEGGFRDKYPTVNCAPWRKSTSLCIPCVKLKNVEDQITPTHAFLRHLEAHRAALKPEVNASHDPFSSLLPTELASRILTLCIGRPSQIPGPNLAPLKVAAVSRRWRAVACSTASLWTFICLRPDTITDRYSYEIFLKRWLSRINNYVKLCESIIETLNEHSSRWASLSLKVPLHLVRLFKGGPTALHHLEKLSICPPAHLDNNRDANRLDLGSPLPSLKNVSVSGFRLRNIFVNWRNVTTVSISRMQINECLELLKSTQHLRECTLENISESDPGAEDPESPIVMEHLAKMDVNITAHFTFPFFDYLILPSLNSLIYCGREQPLDPLTSLILRSSCPIRALSVGEPQCYGHELDLYDLLWSVPTVEELGLHDIYLSDGFFELLARPITDREGSEEPNFLPLLAKFYVNPPSDPTGFSWTAVQRALEERILSKIAEGKQPLLRQVHFEMYVETDEDGYHIDVAALETFQRIVDSDVKFGISNAYGLHESTDVISYSRAYHEAKPLSNDT
ncbi:unnamed protein product [Cyclocybe aegerita]|uniref:F-box domain-containing protein n=1 Tax=Cyclocybe aegerita TaxID=1973307 RepID=A0A8S0VWG1_CYCAE|nr:unnamed protein product [Cyclocybe aegerita]